MSEETQLKLKYLKTISVDIPGVFSSQNVHVYYRADGLIEVYQFSIDADGFYTYEPKDEEINRARKKDPVGEGGTLIYSNNNGTVYTATLNIDNERSFTWDAEVIERAIENNASILNSIKKEGGTIPSFLTSSQVENPPDAVEARVNEEFLTTKNDYFFGDTKAAQYPIDALYDRSENGTSQDHLVLSQYRYKSPRAGDIWGKQQDSTSLLVNGIARSSALDEFLGLVRMPMPNSIQDSNNVAWGADTMNALEAAALREIGTDFKREAIVGAAGAAVGGLEGAASAIGADIATSLFSKAFMTGNFNKSIVAPELQARILGTLGVESSAEAILARKEGVVPNSNLELLFSGPTLRQFGFVYKLSPRSESEATIVNQILRFFKQGMAARKQSSAAGGLNGGRSYFLGTPNVFRLQYRTSDNEAIKGINRIKTCALTGTSVNYTPEGAFASYEKGQPVSILLSLNFQELEPIYDTDYKQQGSVDGNVEGERTSDTGEGYRWRIAQDEVGY